MAAAARVAQRPTDVCGDCEGVVKACSQGVLATPVSGRLVYEGVLRAMRGDPETAENIRRVRGIRAHQPLPQGPLEELAQEERHVVGNNWADQEAKRAVDDQTCKSPGDVLCRFNVAAKVLELMARVLRVWPATP